MIREIPGVTPVVIGGRRMRGYFRAARTPMPRIYFACGSSPPPLLSQAHCPGSSSILVTLRFVERD